MAKSSKSGGTIITLILLAAIAGGAYWYWKRSNEKPPEIITTTVTRGDVIQSITATGILEAPTSVDVSSQISGKILDVLVDFNSPVKEGDVLARIDPATYESKFTQAEAQLANTQANYTLTSLNTERTRELFKKSLVSQQDLDQAEALLKQADAQLAIQRANVSTAKVDLERCTITAPITGIVLDRQTEPGKTVAASLNAPTLFTLITDLVKMQISADVSEADIGAIAEGQDVTFTVDAYPERQFRGKVSQIRNLPKTAQSVVVYSTIIEVDNRDLRLKPGMTANVSIITARRDNVLKIANAALRARIPESLLDGAAAGGGSAADPTPASREQIMALVQESGITFTRGQPLPPADLEKLRKLAAERGLILPENFGSGRLRRRDGDAAAGGTSARPTPRTVYILASPLPNLKITPREARFGISDGTTTEVVGGLEENDIVVTNAYLADGAATTAAATSSPFQQQRFRR
jgi:HlyD family secretion protein